MPEVRVRGFQGEAPGLILSGWPTHVLLIDGPCNPTRYRGDIDAALTGYASGSILELAFEDTIRPKDQFAPTTSHLSRIAAFAIALPDRANLLVLCPVGLGRSTAAAVVVRVALRESPTDALQRTIDDRPRATPNRLMIALGDLVLECNGKLWQAFADWSRECWGLHFDSPVPLHGRARSRVQRETS